ncbi:MAG: DUF4157 domain-containing protein [Candidatus Aminicenantes bacterium]|nr:DUF4157 domain-containing protein [Candidatus Aminicenantes bacterium]NIM84985.1 DUF4157 domain-containing protein [Candidatus Aminicenantes bacterium]NIN24499.1 DUF4157 domain-containing protein [Candidatus Aminicenantes bacterium]NIN48263.1 DUF4157 domain-containing protein [Candidatus Aminicenantes bacterium]NIN91166.1 DUF4157 domain-containing protein [Candidatus Aminicenantes bacterium]
MNEKVGVSTKDQEAKKDISLSQKQNTDFSQPEHSLFEFDQTLFWQRNLGNQAMQRMMESQTIQAKLKIGQPNDKYEKEADRVADQVMRMPEPKQSLVQRESTCPECIEEEEGIQTKPLAEQITPLVQRQIVPEEEEEEEEIQTKPLADQNTPFVQRQVEEEEEEEEAIQTKRGTGQGLEDPADIESRIQYLKGGGHPLSESSRSFFEPRFGVDFNHVRVYTDKKADEAAKSVDARAFTAGSDIVFRAGEYSPGTSKGNRLLAHELTHTIQQDTARKSYPTPVSPAGRRVQRGPAPPPPPTCPRGVNFSTGNHHVIVPICGGGAVRATFVPANLQNINWSLRAGTAQVATGTSINQQGVLTFGPAQTGGTIEVRATRPATGNWSSCFAYRNLELRSFPTGINRTFVLGPPPNPARDYGGTFDHYFRSNDGIAASLYNVPVGERFLNVPNPAGHTHVIPNTPFGRFTLRTRTLTPNATNNWHLTAQGTFGGNGDEVTTEKASVNVGRYLASVSNPNPQYALPASFTLDQTLYWYCRPAPAANRWRPFTTIPHTRTLRLNGAAVVFVTSVNNLPRQENYTGHPGIFNARAVPNRVTRSPAQGTANTVTIYADVLPTPMPAGHLLQFSLRGNALGCNINPNTGVLTIGRRAGQVRIRVRDSQANNPNYDEVTVQIV